MQRQKIRHDPRGRGGQVGQLDLRCLGLVDQGLTTGEKQAAMRGQLDPSRGAGKQAQTQAGLHLGNPARDGAVAQAQLIRRRPKSAMTGDGDEWGDGDEQGDVAQWVHIAAMADPSAPTVPMAWQCQTRRAMKAKMQNTMTGAALFLLWGGAACLGGI